MVAPNPPAAAASDEESLKNLAVLALFVSTHVTNAICAAFVTHVADAYFHQYSDAERRKRFRQNPANTLAYRALSALEERAIVQIGETLSDKNKILPTTATIRRKDDVRAHRDALSHPTLVKWFKHMQPFIDADRHYRDWRPGLVWDLQRSINEELRRKGHKVYNEDVVTVTHEMATELHTILNYSRSATTAIPDADRLFALLNNEAPKFQKILEKYPDGQTDKRKKSKPATG